MTYQEFLKEYGIRLFDQREGRTWEPGLLTPRGGWLFWDQQPFRDEGLACSKIDGRFYRFTSTIEMRGRLQYRIYHRGPEVNYDALKEQAEAIAA